jgi:flagellar biosynthesis anti-sigma factor FlgM
MKVQDPNLSAVVSSPQDAKGTGRSGQSALSGSTGTGTAAARDDVHLSELVQSLRSLAADSPERQARIEQIARSYANGTYQVDSEGTASKIIDDAFQT